MLKRKEKDNKDLSVMHIMFIQKMLIKLHYLMMIIKDKCL